jgi:hypothetical protein
MKHHDSIMVVVDKLNKTTHFIPVKTIHKETHIAEIYMKEVASLHGVPKEIVSDRDYWHPHFRVYFCTCTKIELCTLFP